MGKKEWEWMRQEVKEGRDLKDKTQQQYDDYYSRKSQGDSMKIVVWAVILFGCLGFWYLLFNGIFG